MASIQNRFSEKARVSLLNNRHPRSWINSTVYSSLRRYVRSSNPPPPKRRAVTVTSDDGRVHWSELNTREKAARTTQQSFHFLIIAVGIVMTGGVATFLYTDVFSPTSRTAYFNQAVKRIKGSARCTELLGPASSIMAYGESPWSSFRRGRVAGPSTRSSSETDAEGNEHLRMSFVVRGDKVKEGIGEEGVVNMHLVRAKGMREFEWRSLVLDVKGHDRIWLEGSDGIRRDAAGRGRMFGLKWF